MDINQTLQPNFSPSVNINNFQIIIIYGRNLIFNHKNQLIQLLLVNNLTFLISSKFLSPSLTNPGSLLDRIKHWSNCSALYSLSTLQHCQHCQHFNTVNTVNTVKLLDVYLKPIIGGRCDERDLMQISGGGRKMFHFRQSSDRACVTETRGVPGNYLTIWLSDHLTIW